MRIAIAACAIFALAPCVCEAQRYPVKPLRMLVGFAAGGGADVVARGLSPRLTETLGQQVIVDNRPGANGLIAAELTARAAPDGYTLLIAPGNYAFAPAMESKLSLEHPEVRSRFQAEGAEPTGSSPQAFGAFFKAEIAKWTDVVQKAGIRN